MHRSMEAAGASRRSPFWLLAFLAIGCSSEEAPSSGPTRSSSYFPGFHEWSALGPTCEAAIADDPAKEFGVLTFIPCASGASDCEELRFDGKVKWLTDLEFHVTPALDKNGVMSKVLVVHRYPRGVGYGGVPLEAVGYDVGTGKPLVALRHPAIVGSGSHCEIEPLLSDQTFAIVARTDGGGMVVAAAPVAKAAAITTFRPIKVGPDVLQAPALVSGTHVALESKDGQITRVDLDKATDVSAFGPAIRVRPVAVIGSEIVAGSMPEATENVYAFMDASGKFERAAVGGRFATDGQRVVWTVRGSDNLELWTAPYTRGAAPTGAVKFADLPRTGVLGLAVTNGVVAITGRDLVSSLTNVTLITVDLTSGAVRTRAVAAEITDDLLPIAATAEAIWIGVRAAASDGYERIVRYRLPS